MRRTSCARNAKNSRSTDGCPTPAARAAAAALVCGALIMLTGCVADSEVVATATAAAVARVVADTVAAQIELRPQVDCGDVRIDTTDGAWTLCQITDPETALSYDARVRFINPTGTDRFAVDLAVAPEPTQ